MMRSAVARRLRHATKAVGAGGVERIGRGKEGKPKEARSARQEPQASGVCYRVVRRGGVLSDAIGLCGWVWLGGPAVAFGGWSLGVAVTAWGHTPRTPVDGHGVNYVELNQRAVVTRPECGSPYPQHAARALRWPRKALLDGLTLMCNFPLTTTPTQGALTILLVQHNKLLYRPESKEEVQDRVEARKSSHLLHSTNAPLARPKAKLVAKVRVTLYYTTLSSMKDSIGLLVLTRCLRGSRVLLGLSIPNNVYIECY